MNQLVCTNPFGAPVYHEETVSSTMDTARLLAQQGEPHGTVIMADFQEAGRGRLQRPWKMERGQNLIFTILLRYPGFSMIPQALTLKTGLAVSLAIEDFAPALAGSVLVKWPNDVLLVAKPLTGKAIGVRKTAGILTEAEGSLVSIGIGVNLCQREFPEELRDKVGSIYAALVEAGEKVPAFDGTPRFHLLEKILARLHNELEGRAAPWKPRLEERLFRRDEEVVFVDGAADSGRIVTGRLAGIGEGGELLIVPQGETSPRPFVTGELRVY